jgi:hypothetical protein
MVGNDYLYDIEPAKWLGMATIWVEHDDPYAPGAPVFTDPWAADARASSLSEVPAALTRLARMARLPRANGHVRGHADQALKSKRRRGGG